MNENKDNTVRLLILDTEGVYTKVYDEIYVKKSDADKIKEMYLDYMVVEVPNN